LVNPDGKMGGLRRNRFGMIEIRQKRTKGGDFQAEFGPFS